MCAAACESTLSARLARLMSWSSIARSTATVDQRSSHKRIGRERGARFLAKARTDCVRGLSLPSMLSGSPTTSPAISCWLTRFFSRWRSAVNLPRWSVSCGLAKLQRESQVASPIVLVPTSSPSSRPPGDPSVPRKSLALVAIIGWPKRSSAARRPRGCSPRTGRSRTRGSCSPAARRVPCRGYRQ